MPVEPVTLSNRDAQVQQVRSLRHAVRSLKAGRATPSAFIGDERANSRDLIRSAFQQYAPLAYRLPWEVLDLVELLSTFNPDYSQAVENLKMLANSGHKLVVDADVDLQRRRTRDLLEEKSRTIQEQHGGIDGVVEKLMDQAAVYGAMCGEWILSDDLTEVVDFADINPKKIRFFWDEEEQRYIPFQKVTGAQLKAAKEAGQETRGQCVRLNEITFRYYAFDAAPGSPYGTPPFIAALQNIAIQRDLVGNMAQIVKKIGLLALIDVTIERLQPQPGETDAQFIARASAYLEDYAEAAEEMVKDGGMIHFDDVEVKPTQIGGNAAGATNIHKQNEELIFSGLKSMPSVQGRSYSTTETYAGVAYDIIIRNTLKYQRGAKRMIESGYWLMASLQGLRPTDISVTFHKNRTLQRLQEVQAQSVEIRNAALKWLLGIIDQQLVAQELGYDDPVRPMSEPPQDLVRMLPSLDTTYVGMDDFGSESGTEARMEEEDDRERDDEGSESEV